MSLEQPRGKLFFLLLVASVVVSILARALQKTHLEPAFLPGWLCVCVWRQFKNLRKGGERKIFSNFDPNLVFSLSLPPVPSFSDLHTFSPGLCSF